MRHVDRLLSCGQASFTVKTQGRSSLLPKQTQSMIKYVAAAGTHTNQFLVAVLQGINTTQPLLADKGKMSKAKITEKCPKLKGPLETGLRYFVFS